MIKDFKPREYQKSIADAAKLKNTLVVLPTGLGKTNIFLIISSERLKQYPDSKILMIGPTRPLISQYKDVFLKYFDIEEEKIAVLTGMISPEKRKEIWENSKIVFSTPQGLENDIVDNKISLEEVSLLGIDEAHRAVGNYSYVEIAKKYSEQSKFPRIVGLTASPGAEISKIDEVCKNLMIEEIEMRTSYDEDVRPYVKEINIEWINVELPEEFKVIYDSLMKALKNRANQIKKYGMIQKNLIIMPKKYLLSVQANLIQNIKQGNKNFIVFKTLSLLAQIIKLQHAIELVETQGINSLNEYFKKMTKEAQEGKTKAVQAIVADELFKKAVLVTENLVDKNIEHPKFFELKKIVFSEIKDKEKDTKIIVFVNYRDSATKIVEELNKLKNVNANIFVGQAKKKTTGMSQKEQIQMLQDFKKGKFNVIVMTSVGEEGLDIPSVELVVFYEPVPSAIREIQRRGRTGRQKEGKVIMLIAKGTRDEAYKWAAHHKKKKMHKNILKLKDRFRLRGQTELDKF